MYLRVIYTCVVLALALFQSSVVAIPYSFDNRIDTTDPNVSDVILGHPGINNNGDVAFLAVDNLGHRGIFKVDSLGNLFTIADESAELSGAFSFHPQINDSGVVAFNGGLDSGPRGVFLSNTPGSYSTVMLNTQTPCSGCSFGGVRLNNAGTLAFVEAGGDRVLRLDGSTTTIISKLDDTDIAGFGGYIAMNEFGVVAVSPSYNGPVVRTVYKGNGTTLTPLDDNSGPLDYLGIDVDMNDHGHVIYASTLDTGGERVMVHDGLTSTVVADTAGAYSGFDNPFGNFVIANDGAMYFVATLDAGGKGIFTGDNPINDKVLMTGDLLFGSELVRFNLHGSVNDRGTIAFTYELADGRRGVATATPIPEPSTLMLLAAGGAVCLRRRVGCRLHMDRLIQSCHYYLLQNA